jgi:hypothetical protein
LRRGFHARPCNPTGPHVQRQAAALREARAQSRARAPT